MKRYFAIFLSTVIILSLQLSVAASDSIGNSFTIGSFTIEFSNDSAYNYEEQKILAQRLVLSNVEEEPSSTNYNLLCTMFGHKTTVESVTIIEHCVSDTQPRCLRTIQELTICSRCESVIYTNTISQVYIYCCE